LQSRDGGQQSQLNILGQGGRNAVGINDITVKPFWLKENLV
jgi:hypothetical protein